MRIILVGQAAFAEQVLNGLIERRHDVPAVYCPPDSHQRPDAAKTRALALGIPVHQHPTLKGAAVQDEFAALGADLAVLAYVTQIVARPVFETPRLGSICFHPSLLPRYRGGSAINWQIIRGETQTGVSVFWVDSGIDTGPVLLQKTAAIGPDDTAGTLYYKTLFPLGIAAVLEAVDLIAAGRAQRLPQDETRATYDPLCRDEHAAIDWNWSTGRIYNLIRGCDPQPGAHTTLRGALLRLYDASIVSDRRLRPGVIEQISPAGWLIGAGSGAIRIKRVRSADAKVAAEAFAAAQGVTPGTTLGGTT